MGFVFVIFAVASGGRTGEAAGGSGIDDPELCSYLFAPSRSPELGSLLPLTKLAVFT